MQTTEHVTEKPTIPVTPVVEAPVAAIKCTLQAQAQPYLMQLEIPDAEVRKDLDDLWQEAKKSIPEREWAGFRVGSDAFKATWESKIGITTAYRPIWVSMISAAAAKNERFVLGVSDLSVVRGENLFKLVCIVNFVPEARFVKDFDKVPVEIYSLHPT